MCPKINIIEKSEKLGTWKGSQHGLRKDKTNFNEWRCPLASAYDFFGKGGAGLVGGRRGNLRPRLVQSKVCHVGCYLEVLYEVFGY
jgi:hypothetical protein